jgi:hypothetical protein
MSMLHLKREELMALLNSLYEEGGSFEVLGNVGRKVRLARVRLLPDRARVTRLSTVVYGSPAEDFPSASEYLTCFRMAGANLDKSALGLFEEVLEEFEKGMHVRPKQLYISFDTNCFINRVSYHFQSFAGERGRKVAFVIASGVRQELFREVGMNLGQEEVERLRTKDPWFGEFLGQPVAQDRIWKVGRTEYSRLRDSFHFEETPSGRGDRNIAEGLAGFSRRKNCDVWAFTSDKNMFDALVGRGVRPLFVKFTGGEEMECGWEGHGRVGLILPKFLFTGGEEMECGWEAVRDLLYSLAAVFGFIEVAGSTLYGIWRGKGPEEWYEEMVGVQTESERLRKDLELLEVIREFHQKRASSEAETGGTGSKGPFQKAEA